MIITREEKNGYRINIPEHLRDLSFCKVLKLTKKPFEDEWEKNPYTYEQILPWLNAGNNYGILSGYHNIATIDNDCREYVQLAEKCLPPTFTIQSSSVDKGHWLYYITDFPKHLNKIILIDPNDPDNPKAQGGDIRFMGFQSVGPGSIHPDTLKPYTVRDNLPIAELPFSLIVDVFGKYFKTPIIPPSVKGNTGSSFGLLSIVDVMNHYNIKLTPRQCGHEHYGPHPIHGSTGGTNFSVNTEDNLFHCFRCDSGGDAFGLIAVMEGVIDCSEAKPGGLKGDKFLKTCRIAEEKFGFKLKREVVNRTQHIEVANRILNDHMVIFSAGDFYEYGDGYYKTICEEKVQKWVKDLVGDDFKKSLAEEVKYALQTDIYVEVDKLNATPLLNLKNGLFDTDKVALSPHTPSVFSTIRLNVNYNPQARCDKWVKTVSEILDGDKGKIETLQEFFGLCLTKEVKYQKAMFMLGEGSNGKSTVLFILENLLGAQNKTAISLEMLGRPHYVANLHNKLVNISIETNAKSDVYDAMFKAIVSGDTITADHKFKPPFDFRPYCKLIYALNNMPRVNDKTIAFYRRLLILKFNRQFQGDKDNKNLKYELLEELDGIFLWCLEGLRRLKERKDFALTKEMLEHIEEYRADNNNVLVFVEEECLLDPLKSTSKAELYDAFKDWCERSGNKPLNKKNFGTEIKKQFSKITESRTGDTRSWYGIGLGAGRISKMNFYDR